MHEKLCQEPASACRDRRRVAQLSPGNLSHRRAEYGGYDMAPAVLNHKMEVITMALVRWRPTTDLFDPFAGLEEIRREANRMFDTAFAPALDVVEEQDNFLVKIDLPGLKLGR